MQYRSNNIRTPQKNSKSISSVHNSNSSSMCLAGCYSLVGVAGVVVLLHLTQASPLSTCCNKAALHIRLLQAQHNNGVDVVGVTAAWPIASTSTCFTPSCFMSTCFMPVCFTSACFTSACARHGFSYTLTWGGLSEVGSSVCTNQLRHRSSRTHHSFVLLSGDE